VLPVAPSAYHVLVIKRANRSRLSARAKGDDALKPKIQWVFEENFRFYGVRKVWRQLTREGHDVARCTVAWLMKSLGLQGVIRDKPVRASVDGFGQSVVVSAADAPDGRFNACLGRRSL
jgi:hypothetical protein